MPNSNIEILKSRDDKDIARYETLLKEIQKLTIENSKLKQGIRKVFGINGTINFTELDKLKKLVK